MRIVWNQNPLASTIELDAADVRWFRERLKSHDLEERVGEAHFALDDGHRKWVSEHVEPETLGQSVTRAVRRLDYGFVCGDEKHGEQTYEAWIDKRLTFALEALAGAHEGDCICQPCSCLKCHTEALLGVETIEGLGKHEAHAIEGVFSKDATIEEALAQLSNHVPVRGPAWEKHPQEDFDRHVPRWIEESKRAHAWLIEYRDKHFGLSTKRTSTPEKE